MLDFLSTGRRVAVAGGGVLVAMGLVAPAHAAAPNLPNPCKLLKVSEINTALHKSGAHPAVSHSTYQSGTPYETKTCMWKYGSTTTVTLNIYNKSGGSGGGGATTTKPEPSLGPNGEYTQSTDANNPSTSVSYKRHHHWVGIYVNKNVRERRMVALGKHAYGRT